VIPEQRWDGAIARAASARSSRRRTAGVRRQRSRHSDGLEEAAGWMACGRRAGDVVPRAVDGWTRWAVGFRHNHLMGGDCHVDINPVHDVARRRRLA
jgi:hypothetical protein